MNVLEWAANGEMLEQYIRVENGVYIIAMEKLRRKPGLLYLVLAWGLQHLGMMFRCEKIREVNEYYHVPAEQFERTFQAIKVIDHTKEGMQGWSSFIRRPYYRMVGKKVTPEDAFQLIARYDDCLESALQERAFEGLPIVKFLEQCYLNGYRGYIERAFPMSYVRIPLYGLFAGYVHPDGCIGLNSHTDRCPDMYELFPDFLEMAGGTDKLDVIFILSKWDEREYSRWGALE